MLPRTLVFCLLLAAPGFAREVRGRVTHTEDGSEVFRAQLGNIYVLRANVATETGDVVTLYVQEGATQVLENGVAAAIQAVRMNARIRASIDDSCKLESDKCIASEVVIEQVGGITRVEANRVRDNADAAMGDLDKGMASADPGMKALGGGRASGRDADLSEDFDKSSPCPEGMVPWMKDGKRVIDTDGKPACKVKRQFIKGELTNLGSDKLVVADSRFGLRLGYAHLDNSSYLGVNPEVDMHFGDSVALGLGLPLHVRAYADGFYDTGKIKFREHDYDKPSDYAKILRFLTIGKKEDQFFLNVSQLFAASIGHGAIVRRYSGNIDMNITRVGAQMDAYGKYGGFEAFVGDVVQPDHFLAGLVFLKPLGWLTGPSRETLGWTSIGLSTAMDLKAPYTLCRNTANSYPQVGDNAAKPADLGCAGAAYYEPGEPVVQQTRRAQLVGVDLETKILKTDNADLKPYLDYSRLLSIDSPSATTADPGTASQGGGGFTAGLLGRFNLGDVNLHAFRVMAEGRYFDGNYLPGYFDTFYEVQKYQFITGKADVAYSPKLRTILNRDPNHKRAGYYLEAAYQYNQGFALMVSYEDSFRVSGPQNICPAPECQTNPKDLRNYVGSRNLTLHLEYPVYSWLQFFGSFYRRSFDGAPVDTARPLGDNTLIYGAVRLHVLWIFFLNARIFRTWQADPVLGEMKNIWGGEFDLEIGYEFDRAKRVAQKR
jgi:hypothetical protein